MRRLLVTKRCLWCVGLCIGRESQVLLNELTDLLDQCVKTCAFLVDYRRATHESHEGPIAVLNAHGCRTFATFDHHFDLSILLFLRLENATECANPVNLLRSRLVDSGVVLCG